MLLAVVALAVAAALELSRIPILGRGLPVWDPAEHGLAGVALAEDVRRGDALGFVLDINRQVLWPFVHSLLLLPWVLVHGNDYATTARLSSLLFAGTVVALCVAGLRLHPGRGAWVAAAAAVLVLLAPIYRFFATVCMLEMPGAFLLALTACLHVWACREPAPRALLVAAGVSTSALFLCKYNYGLLWLIPLGIHEWLALPAPHRSAVMERARALLSLRRWLRPFPVFMLLFLLVIVGIQVTGGGVLELLGTRVSVRSPGNALYAFYLATVSWAVVRARRAGGLGLVWRRLSARHRVLGATVAIPLAIWFLIPYPNRVGAFASFVVNRDSGHTPWSLETLLFYPRAFVSDYSPAPAVGWLVLALAALPPRRSGLARDPGTLLYLAFWVGLLATALHQYRQPRFLFTTAPLIWLLAARSAVGLLDRGLGKSLLPVGIRESAWAAALAALLALAVIAPPPAEVTLAAHRAFNAPAAVAPVVDRMIEQARHAGTRPYFLGHWNGMSPALVRWQGLLAEPRLPRALTPGYPVMLPAGSPESAIAGLLGDLRRAGRPVVAGVSDLPFPGVTEDYWRETWVDRVMFARLSADPRVFKEIEEVLPGSGFRIATFRFLDSASVATPRP